jgi:hypothetical protein
MDEKFIFGLGLGMLGGAVIVANSVKARQMVKSGQEQVVEKVSQLTEKKPAKKNFK